MGRLAYGPGNPHILKSNGADVDLMKFYCTQYATTYGKEGFDPRKGKHKGTGYQSNFRPGVYYSRRLDELDNPAMGRLLTDNYTSLTRKHFLASKGSDGKDPYSHDLYLKPSSGFVKDVPVTIPRHKQVKSIHVDTRDSGTVYPYHRTLLNTLKEKDPIGGENAGHGPSYMSTECHTRFRGTPSQRMDTSTKSVGYKEGSGFTHAYNDEPVTFRPTEAHDGLRDPRFTWRPTGTSIMKTHFLPTDYPRGHERLPILSHGAVRDTGFTNETANPVFYGKMSEAYTKLSDTHPRVQERIKKQDPTEFINMSNPHNKSSVASYYFKGAQRNDPTHAGRLGSVSVGRKELTGYSENNDKFFETAETTQSLKRFHTHYGDRFYDKNPNGEARMGRTRGEVMTQLPDGFTKSTSVHSYGPDLNTTAQLRGQMPYVARSIKARDPFYDDHTHDNKLRPMASIRA